MKTNHVRVMALLVGFAFLSAAQAQTQFPLFVSNQGANTISEVSSGGVVTPFITGDANVNNPFGLVFDGAGNLYVASFNSDLIEKFSPTGTDLGKFATTASGPYGLAIDSTGNIYAALDTTGEVEKFTPGGASSAFATSLSTPTSVAFDSSGNVYVAENGSNKVEKYSSTGTDLGTFISGGVLSKPQGIAFDSSGNLYVDYDASSTNGAIEKFSPSGADLGSFGTGVTMNQPEGLTFDSSGNLYVANANNTVGNNIDKFTPSGTGSVFASTGSPSFMVFGVPEPGCAIFLALGAAALLTQRRRKATVRGTGRMN